MLLRTNSHSAACLPPGEMYRDPIGTFNLTSAAYSKCMVLIKAQAKPLLVLGGGGYHRADVVRCWTVLTALAAQRGAPQCLTDSIPDHGSILEYVTSSFCPLLVVVATATSPNAYISEVKLPPNLRAFLKLFSCVLGPRAIPSMSLGSQEQLNVTSKPQPGVWLLSLLGWCLASFSSSLVFDFFLF